jgi:hypothetical protein
MCLKCFENSLKRFEFEKRFTKEKEKEKRKTSPPYLSARPAHWHNSPLTQQPTSLLSPFLFLWSLTWWPHLSALSPSSHTPSSFLCLNRRRPGLRRACSPSSYPLSILNSRWKAITPRATSSLNFLSVSTLPSPVMPAGHYWRIKDVSTYDPQAYGPTPFSPRDSQGSCQSAE